MSLVLNHEWDLLVLDKEGRLWEAEAKETRESSKEGSLGARTGANEGVSVW